MPTPYVKDLKPYEEAGWTLIPLHRYDAVDTYRGKPRKRGKSPQHANWTRRLYDQKSIRPHMADGGNVGVRLTQAQLVIDVDPRHFPEGETLETETNPLVRLAADCGFDPYAFPVVETGSGGLHIYMRKPGDISVRDTHPDYDGIEFKTLGRQVVAAGSIHPDTFRLYTWSPWSEQALKAVSAAPKELMILITRPINVYNQGDAGGEYDAEEVAIMLEALDPSEFRDQQEWFELMQACHHASAGEARLEFLEWSASDPEYGDRQAENGKRWDSLHYDRPGRKVTAKTLLKHLHKRGLSEVIPRASAADDFKDEDPDIAGFVKDMMAEVRSDPATLQGLSQAERDKIEEDDRQANEGGGEALGPLESLNKKYWIVQDAGKTKIMSRVKDPSFDPPRFYWAVSTKTDFLDFYMNRVAMVGEKFVPLGEAWMKWPQRRQMNMVVFDPTPDKNHGPKVLNLWNGWNVKPSKRVSGWSLLDDLIRTTLCAGDERVYEYVLNWCAFLFQKPHKPAEVVIAFQGKKGTGKGTLGRTLANICGVHGMAISSAEHLTGRFNSHLRDLVFLFADEALTPQDTQAHSRLKTLVTEPILAYEGKGANIAQGPNRLHVMMASNEGNMLPIGWGDGERRYMLQEVADNRRGDREFFRQLNKQMREGGEAAFLFDMQNRELGDWHPRDNIPPTQAMARQQENSLGNYGGWWINILMNGRIEGVDPVNGEDGYENWWKGKPIRFFATSFNNAIDAYFQAIKVRGASNNRALEMARARELKDVIAGFDNKGKAKVGEDHYDVKAGRDGRANIVEMASLDDCRAFVDAKFMLPRSWPDMLD